MRFPNIISIHAAREGGDLDAYQREQTVYISIHAAREGGDASCAGISRPSNNFNPRRP